MIQPCMAPGTKRHKNPELLQAAVYGLPELRRETIKTARLVANPGCYPTSIILGLKPLLDAGLIDPASIIADSGSGVSGAGRSAKVDSLYCEANEGFKAYGVGGLHRHTPEIEQELSELAGQAVAITFTPHLVPMDRGILSTVYATPTRTVSADELVALYASAYRDYGIEVRSVSELTNVPPLVGGQVKTFHPAVYAGNLARRDDAAQLAELAEHGIGAIDIVVVNVKPFAPQVGARQVDLADVIELIDVGGVALLGAAARNYAAVAAIANPTHYGRVARELRELGVPVRRAPPAAGRRGVRDRGRLPRRDRRVPDQVSGTHFPSRLAIVLEKVDDLRYGENPHQRAAFYRETTHRSGTLADARQLQGGQPASTTCSTSMQRTGSRRTSPPRRSRSSSTPIRSGSPPTTSSSRPTATPSRPIRSPRSAGSSASTASWTGRPPGRSRPTHTRR